jgi:hypothetical protein
VGRAPRPLASYSGAYGGYRSKPTAAGRHDARKHDVVEDERGAQLALWPRASLWGDSTMPATPPSPTGFSLGQNVGSKEAVDAVMTQAAAA